MSKSLDISSSFWENEEQFWDFDDEIDEGDNTTKSVLTNSIKADCFVDRWNFLPLKNKGSVKSEEKETFLGQLEGKLTPPKSCKEDQDYVARDESIIYLDNIDLSSKYALCQESLDNTVELKRLTRHKNKSQATRDTKVVAPDLKAVLRETVFKPHSKPIQRVKKPYRTSASKENTFVELIKHQLDEGVTSKPTQWSQEQVFKQTCWKTVPELKHEGYIVTVQDI